MPHASSESDYELFERSSEEDENNIATEGVDKEFPLFVPKYIEDWIQKAKECDWNESEFVQWLKDFDEINDNLHINLHISEDTWLTTSAIEDTSHEILEDGEESISIEELLKPCESNEEEKGDANSTLCNTIEIEIEHSPQSIEEDVEEIKEKKEKRAAGSEHD